MQSKIITILLGIIAIFLGIICYNTSDNLRYKTKAYIQSVKEQIKERDEEYAEKQKEKYEEELRYMSLENTELKDVSNMSKESLSMYFQEMLYTGELIYKNKEIDIEISDKWYVTKQENVKMQYKDLVTTDEHLINLDNFLKLNTGAKQKFLKDIFRYYNNLAYVLSKEYPSVDKKVYEEIIEENYWVLNSYEGMGSVLMWSLIENTKPDRY